MISATMREWLNTVSFTPLPEDTERVNGLPVLEPEPDDPDDVVGEVDESDERTAENGEDEDPEER